MNRDEQTNEESLATPEIESSQSFLDVPDNIPMEAEIMSEDVEMDMENDNELEEEID